MDHLLKTQVFTDSNLKQILLSNLESNPKTDNQRDMNNFLRARVDKFWTQVVVPLKGENKFDGNKIQWYYDIYKEGLEARNVATRPFDLVQVDKELVTSIVKFYNEKTLAEYLTLGSTYLVSTKNVLLAWTTSQQLIFRLTKFYNSENPVDWIRAIEAQGDRWVEGNEIIQGVNNIINNISYILSKRI